MYMTKTLTLKLAVSSLVLTASVTALALTNYTPTHTVRTAPVVATTQTGTQSSMVCWTEPNTNKVSGYEPICGVDTHTMPAGSVLVADDNALWFCAVLDDHKCNA